MAVDFHHLLADRKRSTTVRNGFLVVRHLFLHSRTYNGLTKKKMSRTLRCGGDYHKSNRCEQSGPSDEVRRCCRGWLTGSQLWFCLGMRESLMFDRVWWDDFQRYLLEKTQSLPSSSTQKARCEKGWIRSSTNDRWTIFMMISRTDRGQNKARVKGPCLVCSPCLESPLLNEARYENR
jgi:hypothetical protein